MKMHKGFVVLLMAAPSILVRAADNPWAEVPPLPTSCYKDGDRFEQEARVALEALNRREAEQVEINHAIEQQSGEVDMMALQQRMITFMSEHPEQAQRYMQILQQGGQQIQEQTPEMAERSTQFETELQELKAAYAAELQQALGPIEERQQALGAALEKSCNKNLLTRAAALEAEQNRAYEGLCASWWKTGPFHDWFARFKQFKIEEAGIWAEHAETMKLNFEMTGITADQYRSTDDLKGPVDYLRRATEVFFQRRWGPASEEPGSCELGHG